MNYADTLQQTLTSPAEFAEATEAMFHDAFLTDADIWDREHRKSRLGMDARVKELTERRDRAKACLAAMMSITAQHSQAPKYSYAELSSADMTIASHLYALCQAYAERNSDEGHSL